MSLFKLNMKKNEGISSGILEKVTIGTIDYEKSFENWLENSPNVLFDEDEGNTVIWVGRQTRAHIGDTSKYPDLIGIDSAGDVVIVELKKGRTPREVVAQALEYASWVSKLSYTDLNEIFLEYMQGTNEIEKKTLLNTYKEVFYPDLLEDINVELNKSQKIYILAEEVTPIVKQVTAYLRNSLVWKFIVWNIKFIKQSKVNILLVQRR